MLPTLDDRITNPTNASSVGVSGAIDVSPREPANLRNSRANSRNPYESPLVPTRRNAAEQPPTFDGGSWFQNALHEPSPSRGLALFIAIPAIVAFSLSVYLAVTSLTSSNVAGCSGNMFDCSSVLKSRWALWFGIPVSALATVTYLGLLSALSLSQIGPLARRNFMWIIVTLCSLSAGAAALWFCYLQFFVLNHLCQYCLVAHGCGILLATTLLLKHPLGTRTNTRMGILALTGLAILTVGQTLGKPPVTFTIENYVPSTVSGTESDSSPILNDESNPDSATDAGTGDEMIFEAPDVFEAPSLETSHHQPRKQLPLVWRLCLSSQFSAALLPVQDPVPAKTQAPAEKKTADEPAAENPVATPVIRRLASISGGNIKLDLKQWPLVGNPDAEFVFVEMFDYACPHCRHTHAAIKGANEMLGGQLAVLALPLPLNTNCNSQIVQTGALFGESCQISMLAVAVWLVDQSKCTEFHNWMFTGPNAPNYATARAHADTLVDPEKLAAQLASPVPAAFVSKHVLIYQKIGKGNVPKLMFPTTSIVGEFGSAAALVDVIKEKARVTTIETPGAK